MVFLKNWTYPADPGMPARSDVADSSHWNLWRARLPPFNEITDGSEVVLVDSWPGGGRLTWQVAARNLVAAPYTSKAAAVRQIASALGLTRRHVQEHEYTVRGPDTGFLLAWRYRPIRRLDIPRPADMRFRQNGWLKVDDPPILQQWGLSTPSPAPAQRRQTPRTPIGQGRLGPAERVAVEEHAMKLAEDWCRSNRWQIVDDVSRRSSWDLEARKRHGGRPVFVEVKGTTGKLPVVELTAAEVRHARGHPADTALVVVTDIVLRRGGVSATASGGRIHAWYPWSPVPSELTTTMYRWRTRSGPGSSSS